MPSIANNSNVTPVLMDVDNRNFDLVEVANILQIREASQKFIFEATRQIRMMESKANEKNRNGDRTVPEEGFSKAEWHLPILAMTADVIQATYEECTKCGMDGYVSKPFEEVQLYQAVAKFLVSDS